MRRDLQHDQPRKRRKCQEESSTKVPGERDMVELQVHEPPNDHHELHKGEHDQDREDIRQQGRHVVDPDLNRRDGAEDEGNDYVLLGSRVRMFCCGVGRAASSRSWRVPATVRRGRVR